MNHLEILSVLSILAVLLLIASCSEANAVTDARLHAKRGTDVHFDLVQYKSLDVWQAHAKQVREQILTGCGLNPMPKMTPLRARIFGKIDKGDYTVETVTFQSYPGLYVVGNLCRPKGKQGPFPAILNPHGHGADGRLVDNPDYSSIARCVNFAKLGMVAFAYSMIGYNENKQIEHRFPPTPRQELWGISAGGLQLWNSIRAVDFVSALPDVDARRIGCTGESGGGTQTFMLSAVDDRVKVNSPVCMISGMMQGGCVCENAPLARIDSNSVEIGCLMAPRPMLMVAASGDWTKETREREYPASQAVYKLYGAESKVGMYYQDAGHNYNKNSREHVYAWFQRWLLGQDVGEMTPEHSYDVDPKQLMAFTELPKDALSLDQLTEKLIGAHRAQIDGFGIKSKSSLDRYRRTFGSALRRCFGVTVPKKEEIVCTYDGEIDDQAVCLVEPVTIGRKGVGDAIPGVLFLPKIDTEGNPVLIVHSSGKAALFDADGHRGELIDSLLQRNRIVLAIDCFLTGDADKHDERVKEKFFTTFYRTDAAERVQDIVTALEYLDSYGSGSAWRASGKVNGVDLIGLGNAGIECLFARAFEGGSGSTVSDANGCDAGNDQDFVDSLFVPAIRCAGDVRTAAAMIAPGKLTIFNADKGFPTDWIKRAYKAAGRPGNLTVTAAGLTPDQIVGKL